MKRVVLFGAATIAYLVAAWMVAPGFYDGFSPPQPYNFVCPPPQAVQNVELWPRTTVFVEATIATVLAVVVALEARPGWSVPTRVAVVAIPPAA